MGTFIETEKAIGRLKRWRDVGDTSDPAYCAGNELFTQDVKTALAEIDRLKQELAETAAELDLL